MAGIRLRAGFASGFCAADFDAGLPVFALLAAFNLVAAFDFRTGTDFFVADLDGFFAWDLATVCLPEDFVFAAAGRRFDAAGFFGAAFFFAMLGFLGSDF